MGERLHILELVEQGEISADEGARRLESLSGGDEPLGPSGGSTQAADKPAPAHAISQGVFWGGVGLLCGGAWLVSAVYAWHIASAWQIVGWLLFALGLLIAVAGWWLQRARWLSLRVHEDGKPQVTLVLPLPLGLLEWGVRIARPWVPQLRDVRLDELILLTRQELQSGQPVVVSVDQASKGGRVQITLG